MPIIELKTIINSDIETCFNLARDINLHQKSLEHSKERAIAGRTSGLIELGESVTWEAIHFGVKQRLTSIITEFDFPNYFVDEQASGPFESFKHEHIFGKVSDNQTEMTDLFEFESPRGFLGKFANWLFLKRYMTDLLETRNGALKKFAES
ncbi:SRPBCC family protein [Winogradskyella maritima]|uniref:Cell division protein n=1 Tax=Winogradskyella maritima TaxID=1517766 RepID=A0ABV8AMB3_9FLAO|nr:SRPBCC family protein [Winogradskyella maritima]